MKGRRLLCAVILIVALAVVAVLKQRYIGRLPIQPSVNLDAPSPLATWPWKEATKDSTHAGVTHWFDRSSSDGTLLDLFDFDFVANPRLRLELYDQDEDDATPFDNNVEFWPRSVGQITRYLNARGRGKVIAAWNGLFFTFEQTQTSRSGRIGHHLAPVVLRGRTYYNVGNHRWTFGLQSRAGKPVFKTLHLPDKNTLVKEFTYGAAGAQCLIREGVPLKLKSFPRPNEKPMKAPVSSTPEEAGHIPVVDHMKTSRTSMAWSNRTRESADSRHFYLLIVKEPDAEAASALALNHRVPMTGGWMVSDLQRFWLAMKVWGAVNIDGGDVTQMAFLRTDGAYTMVPPRWTTTRQRLTFPTTFQNAPAGGTMMYFYVRDSGSPS